MIVIPSNQAVFSDVDDTLIMWNATPEQLEKDGIRITCPGGLWLNEDGELVPSESWTQLVVPHKVHIEQLKKHKARGHTVVVWSAGGWDWARAAVEALGLEQFVDVVISKPRWCYDDLPPAEYMPKSQWMQDPGVTLEKR